MKTLTSWKPGSALAGMILLGALATLPAHAQYPSLIEAQSPLDYWRLNETTASPAINIIANQGSTGAAGTGYVVAGALTGEPGIVGNSVRLINSDDTVGNVDSRIDIPNLPALNPQAPFTIEFWAKPATISSDSTGLAVLSSDSPFPGDTSRSGYLFYLRTGSVAGSAIWTFRLGGEDSYTATAATPNELGAATAWTYIVGEFDGTTASIYINGVLAGSGNASPSAPFHANAWVPTRLGGTSLLGGEYADANGNGFYGDGNRGYDGWIDEFAIYNTLLDTNTIMSHYTAGTSNPSGYDALILASSPVGYWNCDEPAYTAPPTNSYTYAGDLGSLMDDGTNTLGTLADQPGVPGLSVDAKSVFYSGTSGSLALDTNVAPPNVAGDNLTLAAWIKPVTFGYVSDIIEQGFDLTTYAENFLRAGDAFDWEAFSANNSGGNYNPEVVPDVPYYEVGAYDGGPGYVSAVYPAPPGDIGHWVFLVGTFDGVNWNLYRNGSLVGQFPGVFADGSPSGPVQVSDPWSVGSRSNPNVYFGQFFTGSIEEACIITNALDAGTISNLYNSVALPPVITAAPVAPEPAYLGSAASFSVWADGPGGLSYQWSSNGVPVSGATGTNFSLTGLTAAANATYSVVATSPYGAVTSAVVLVVTPTLPPATLVPATEVRWVGSPLSFQPASLPNQTLSFQWELNGFPIGGATESNYTATTSASTLGSYTLVISNAFGVSTSSVSTLTDITPPNLYSSTILGDHPVAYFRLDETGGTIGYDYAGGNNGNYYGGVEFGVPGYSLIDTDTAVSFPGTVNSYLGDIGADTINFNGLAAEFTIEAWANGAAGQNNGAAVIVKGQGNNGGNANEQFAIAINGSNYRFYVRDKKSNIAEADAKSGPDGTWHHLVGVCDEVGGSLTFYIDGVVAATAGFGGLSSGDGIIDSLAGVSIGAERSGVLPNYDLDYNGSIDEVAIYATNLSPAQVEAHYAAAYGPNLPPFITLQPVSATNYLGLPVTLTVSAAGTQPLSYQWNKAGSGPVSGATTTSLSIPAVAYTDAGTYTVGITNTLTGGVVTGIVSSAVTLTVLEPPTTPPPIAGLVLHLPFDGDLLDATGRGNNATNMASGGAPLITNNYVAGVIGEAFAYQTTCNTNDISNGGTTNANYATLGVRPDLQFGSNISFSVSMWVQEPADYLGGDLPFFCDVIGSTFSFPGFCFEPGFTNGTWGFSVFDSADAGIGVYGDSTAPHTAFINDGGWHNLIYVIDRKAGATVYLDGLVAHQNLEEGTTAAAAADIDGTNAATIGQDPTGLYPQPAQPGYGSGVTFYIDDLGVWAKALSPLEAAAIYTAGFVNQVSFTGAPVTFSLTVLPGQQLQLTWDAGTIQSAPNVNGPWTDVAGASSPYVVSPSGTQQFFRGKL